MKINVNGQLVDATPQQEAEILNFQYVAQRNPSQYKEQLQLVIDLTAQSKDYKDGFACASYATSTNPQWAAEAASFITWRDNVFIYAYDYLEKVQNGQISNPNVEEFIAGIPVMVWPNVN